MTTAACLIEFVRPLFAATRIDHIHDAVQDPPGARGSGAAEYFGAQQPGAVETTTTDGAEATSSLVAGLESLSWIDLTALAVLIVFFVLGLFRGLVWQIGRIASLLFAYVAAGIWGAPAAGVIRGWFSASVDERLPLYVASFLVFLGVLILVSLLTWLLQKLVQTTGLRFYDRLGGGMLGLATGALVFLAFLTSAFMAERVAGIGGGIVEAAERSKSLEVGHGVLRAASDVLPDPWRRVPDEWRLLLHDPEAPPPLPLPPPTTERVLPDPPVDDAAPRERPVDEADSHGPDPVPGRGN